MVSTQKLTKNKIKSQAGETIAEVLVALLISALALVMLAAMISSTYSIVRRGENKMNEYYEVNNETLASRSSGDDGTASYSSSSEGDTLLNIPNTSVTVYVNDKFGETRVVAYNEKNNS